MIWALFLLPEYEGRGLGRALLDRAVGWLWEQGAEWIELTTEPGTRADGFYARVGRERGEMTGGREVRYTLSRTPAVNRSPSRWDDRVPREGREDSRRPQRREA